MGCQDGEELYEYGEYGGVAGAVCGPQQWACHSQLQCIPATQRCDGEFDCTDGSEANEC